MKKSFWNNGSSTENCSIWNKQFSPLKMDQITRGDKESFIDKKNRIACVGKSDVGKKILTSKEKNNNKRISSLTGTKSQIRQCFFLSKASWVYNKQKIKYWCAVHRMSLPLENISNSAAKNSSFNRVTKLPQEILKET